MIPYLTCMVLVANTFGLPPRILPAIQMVEGGKPGVASPNSNGTEDLGVMQINTIWVPIFAKQIGLPAATVRDRLLNQPCFNIAVAGAIMSMHMAETKGDLGRALGDYHSRTPALHEKYLGKIGAAAEALFGKTSGDASRTTEPPATPPSRETTPAPPKLHRGREAQGIFLASNTRDRRGP